MKTYSLAIFDVSRYNANLWQVNHENLDAAKQMASFGVASLLSRKASVKLL